MSSPNEIVRLMQRANAAFCSGQFVEAESLTRSAIAIGPTNSDLYVSLGTILKRQNRIDHAIDAFKKALSLNPAHSGALSEIGTIFLQRDQLAEGATYLEKAIRLAPNNINALNNLGIAYQRLDRLEDALCCYRQAIALDPNRPQMPNNIGLILQDLGRMDEAIANFRQALTLDPNYIPALNNLATAYSKIGRIEEAVAAFKRLLQIDPSRAEYASNLLMSYHYRNCDPQELFQHHLDWTRKFASNVASLKLTPNRDPNRKLRIAYMSPDFREHSVSYYIEPIIANHDRDQFHVALYIDVDRPVNRTHHLASLADEAHSIAGITDAQVANLIASHKIDILIELTGHSGKNRLLACACKPAPLQLTWIGYPNTTGLSQIDYRVTDAIADPPGASDHLHSEKLLRLPSSFLLYGPPKDAPEVSPPPFVKNGYITFGSFNNFSKLSPQALDLWARLLAAIPDSHLLLKSRVMANESTRNHVIAYFSAKKVAPSRLHLLAWEQSTANHLARYSDIDIALDPFPYNGTTTTSELLYMGVPVITLLGNTHHSRVGASLLSTVGLARLIAKSEDDYIAIAQDMASNRDSLKHLRQTLRNHILQTPMMDPRQFMPSYESELRRIWSEFCQRS